MLPRKVLNWNFFIEGAGYQGRAEEVVLPKLTRKTEEYRAGGMNAPVELDMGMEKLEMEFTLCEYTDAVMRLFGHPSASGVQFRLVAAAFPDDGTSTDSIEISVRGRLREVDQGTLKAGDKATMKVMVAVAYYKYTLNGDVITEIDVANFIENIGGVDRLAQQRQSLGM